MKVSWIRTSNIPFILLLCIAVLSGCGSGHSDMEHTVDDPGSNNYANASESETDGSSIDASEATATEQSEVESSKYELEESEAELQKYGSEAVEENLLNEGELDTDF